MKFLRHHISSLPVIILVVFNLKLQAQTPSFTIPDTVCVNSSVAITNTTTGASAYFWSFCTADINKAPGAVNLGNPGNTMNGPVFTDFVNDNGNYYVFAVNNYSGAITRLSFGKSLLNNNPTAVDLGNLGGVLDVNAEGIQVVKNNGKWYAFIVGGDPQAGTNPKLVKVEFGANIANNSPIATDWGNLGNLNQPIDLYMFNDGATWHAFTTNAKNSTITRFDFSSNLSIPPAAFNLGNAGNMIYPTGIYAVNNNGEWYVFITDAVDNTLTRLDFGSSLLNVPFPHKLGNPGNLLSQPRDIAIISSCNGITGFIVNGTSNDILKLNFNEDITATPSATSLGDIGDLNFPHSISKLFRVGSDVYSFITNVSNNTITRLKFSGCTNSSIANSTAKDPPVVTYSTPGTYNINLTIDDGLPTQNSVCKQVVVSAGPNITVNNDTAICIGDSMHLAASGSASSYSWLPTSGLSKPTSANTVAKPTVTTKYYVTAKNATGCVSKDSVLVNVNACTVITPDFTIPDTVCINSPVSIKNTTTGASSYFWNFCAADINKTPQALNLGNPGSVLNGPVFTDFVSDNGNYYVFVVNSYSASLTRLDFGNNLLNQQPAATDLGNFNGVFPSNPEGIQVVNSKGHWYAIVVGGDPLSGAAPKIVKIDFGNSLTNPSPVIIDWGNPGNLSYPHDLYVFSDGANWHGLVVNARNNTITEFDFGDDFSTTPVGKNLGNIGGLISTPVGIYATEYNGKWYAFVTNGGNSRLTRLDFGSSLLNTPTAMDLGNSGNVLHNPRDIYITKYCGNIIGFVVNGDQNYNDIVKLDFKDDLTSTPTATSLGNIGSLDFPHSISKFFRVGADVYSFITNVSNNTITRLQFAGCTDASIPNSLAQNPPPVIYSKPGIYNINLSVDDGMPTQNSLCKQVVVLGGPNITVNNDTAICIGDSMHLAASGSASSYSWLPTSGLSKPTSANTVAKPTVTTKYYVTAKNATGCVSKDSVLVNVNACTVITPDFTIPDTVCINSPVNIKNNTTGATSYYWNYCSANINKTPGAVNLGNIGGYFSQPVFSDLASYNGNYYAFVVNYNPGGLVRLDFGSSYLNPPTAVFLGNVGGVMNNNYGSEGIQVVQNEGKWYAIITGGSPINNGSVPKIIKIEFGTNLANNNPVATDWGNVGKLLQCIDLYLFKDNINWYGFTCNSENNTITSFNFGSSFNNKPAGTNLGNLGILNYPTGIYSINDDGKWYVFVLNGSTDQKLIRLDFGSSLLNTPTPVDLGNPGNLFHSPRDITIMKSCDGIVGFVVNGDQNYNDIIKLNFNGGITSKPVAVSLGNIGAFAFPHSISKLFRAGADIYSFVTNVANNTISRVEFPGCTNSSIPNSTLANPPAATYSTPGTYNITLTIDDGLPTQNSICRQVVVLGAPNITVNNDTTICSGDSLHLTASGAASYTWLPVKGLSNPNAANTVAKPAITTKYYVTARDAFGCVAEDSVLLKVTSCTCDANPDFSFARDVCNPGTITFSNETQDASVVSWDFGNGKKAGNVQSQTINYSSYGSYTVKLLVQTTGGCIDSTSKNIKIDFLQDSLIITNDTTLCSKGNVQLNALPALSYCWSPATGLSATDIANPVAAVSKNTTYYLSTQTIGTNLIKNGDFSLGIAGFTSAYSYQGKNTTEGEYYVGFNPKAWNGVFSSCSEHTGNNGLMMFVNGNTVADLKVWSETITIKPNTNYAFSVWLQAVYPVNPAQLQFFINGKQVGNIFSADPTPCNWEQFFITWNSGDSSLANISVINKNTAAQGNDFALDDISFAETSVKRDSVNIQLSSSLIKTSADTSICSGDSVNISATAPGNSTYSWSPLNNISNPSLPSPTVSPAITTTYYVQVKNKIGCTNRDSVKVNVLPQPTISTVADTAICNGTAIELTSNAVGANTYSWSPKTGLSNAAALSPLATPLAKTQYIITANPGGRCIAKDTVTITVKVSPSVKNSADTSICSGTSAQLKAESSDNVVYSWSPNTGLTDTSIYNPIASPSATTKYYITVASSNNCTATDSITLSVLPQPSVATIADTAICSGTTIKLITTAVNDNAYSWSPKTGLSSTSVISPSATPPGNIQYIVTVNPGTKCFAKDTVNIAVNPSPSVKSSADTSICSGASAQLTATSSGNVVYNWFPKNGLNDSSISNPIASPASTIQYLITVTGTNECIAKDSVTLTVLPQPVVATLADTTICSGVAIRLTTNAVNGNTYNWSPTAALSDPLILSPSATPITATKYIITVNPGSQCAAKDTVNISVNPLPGVQATGDTILCAGGSAALNASSPANVTFSWLPVAGLSNPSVPNPIAKPSSSVTYSVMAVDAKQCSSTASVIITVNPQPVFAVAQPVTKICIGAPLTLQASGGDIYHWTPLGTVASPDAASTQVFPATNTTYQVIITNSTCKVTDTVFSIVTVSQLPVVTISKSNDLDCVLAHSTLQATGGSQYAWSPSNGLDNPKVSNPSASPFETTTYTVIVKNEIGCATKDSITINVTTANGENGYKLASAFTPNGDNINDCFGLKYWGGVKTLQFEIYNRWGNRVFYTNDPSACWDGTFKGIPQLPGAFIYQIRATTICGNVYRKGTVVLIR